MMNLDYLGDELPLGYEPWMCHVCTAACNFEAMTMCAKRHGERECGFERDQPESNGSAFGFMRRSAAMPQASYSARRTGDD